MAPKKRPVWATLVLPCGTGNTRVSMRIMSVVGTRDLGVVLVPSMALIAQVGREYLSHIGRPVRTLAVCSDTTAGHVDIEQDPNLAADPTRDAGQVRAPPRMQTSNGGEAAQVQARE